jgi:hypothetical protein
LRSGKLTLSAIYLRRVIVVGRSFAAALTHVSRVVTAPAPAAQNLCVGLRRPRRGQTCGGKLGAITRIALCDSTRRVERQHFCLYMLREGCDQSSTQITELSV